MKKGTLGLVLLFAAFVAVSAFLVFSEIGFLSFFSVLLSVAAPLALGSCIAFIMNIPMSLIEKLFLRIAKPKRKFAIAAIRGASILLSLALVIAVFAAFVGLIFPETKLAILRLIESIPDYMEKISSLVRRISNIFNAIPSEETLDWGAISDTLAELFVKHAGGLLGATLDIAVSLVSLVATFVVSIIVAIYILATKERIFSGAVRICLALFSVKTSEKIFSFLNLVSCTFRSYISGQVTEAFILGGLCFVGMTVFSFPYALMTASLMTVTALIPVFGAWIGAAGGALMIITASPSKAIWFLIFIVILQQLENNLIYPRVVGKSVGLPALWVFLSVALGSSLLGIVGMLAGVPIASVIYCLFTKKSLEYKVHARVGGDTTSSAPQENASEESQIM